MSTILFNQIVFGPIVSRRLGISLGVNLLPYDGKLCSFNCIYCECGLNEDFRTKTKVPTEENVKAALWDKLEKMHEANEKLDVITFAGNGEPTLHPHFAEIIDYTINVRNRFYPDAKITVLSNAMHITNSKVFEALKKVDNNVLKLDSAIESTAIAMDQPQAKSYSIAKQVELFKRFDGDFILQTMFLKANYKGVSIDNSTDLEVEAWLKIVKETNPKEVMVYTVDRETPVKSIEKVPLEKLKEIASKVEVLGIKVNVAG